ncbi:DUF4136 domain-containing protein [Thalassotalea litorea]|uniref:DUF4136 domain-containing protein n=1 Tax=Thalassotalea litorea TaxID=2020715 RepID=A0A5R9IE83_9GAMM|nr:DUF4136 domain-containing protein [Thalassotalea litorea]TLU61683.1 DUF4136 domain-containing protein [Thalassotalea litorea]
MLTHQRCSNSLLSLLTASMVVLLLSGCQSSSAVMDYDTQKDFSVINEFSQEPSKQGIKNDDFTNQRLSNAVETQLLAKGFSKSANPQSEKHITVSHFITTRTKQNNSSINIGLGTGRSGSSSSVGVGVNTSIPVSGRETVEVRVTIDFHQQGKLIWRGYDTFNAKGNDSPEKRQNNIDNTVASILALYPPGES